MISLSSGPAPTEGSWSGSPIITRRQSAGSALSSALISSISTMDVSSRITASTDNGFDAFLTNTVFGALAGLGLQQAVDGGRAREAELAHALGRPPGGRGQGHLQAHRFVQPDDTFYRRCLAGAGSACQEHHLRRGGQADGLQLPLGVVDVHSRLELFKQEFEVCRHFRLRARHAQQPHGRRGLGVVDGGQVARLLPSDGFFNDAFLHNEHVQRRADKAQVGVEQLTGGGDQLSLGQEHVAVCLVVPELEEERAGPPGGGPSWSTPIERANSSTGENGAPNSG